MQTCTPSYSQMRRIKFRENYSRANMDCTLNYHFTSKSMRATFKANVHMPTRLYDVLHVCGFEYMLCGIWMGSFKSKSTFIIPVRKRKDMTVGGLNTSLRRLTQWFSEHCFRLAQKAFNSTFTSAYASYYIHTREPKPCSAIQFQSGITSRNNAAIRIHHVSFYGAPAKARSFIPFSENRGSPYIYIYICSGEYIKVALLCACV